MNSFSGTLMAIAAVRGVSLSEEVGIIAESSSVDFANKLFP